MAEMRKEVRKEAGREKEKVVVSKSRFGDIKHPEVGGMFAVWRACVSGLYPRGADL